MALALATALLAPGFALPGPPQDEGQLVTFPEQVLAGRLPHRDFVHFYGGGDVWALAAVYAATGPGLMVERVVGLGYRLLLVGALFALGWRWGAAAALAAAGLSALVLAPTGVAAYAWFGGVALAVAGLATAAHAEERGSDRAWALAGALQAAALSFRPDLVLAVAGALLGFLPRNPRAGRALAAGLALGLAPLAVHVLVVGPGTYVEGVFIDPVFRIGHEQRLPIPPLAAEPRRLFWLLAAAVLIALLALGRGAAAPGPAGRLFRGAALLAFGLLHQGWQHADTIHLRYVGCVLLPLVPLATLQLADAARRPAALLASAALLAGGVPALVEPAWAVQRLGGPRGRVTHQGRSWLLWPASDAADLPALLARVEERARTGDRLFVGPADLRVTTYNDVYLYHLLPRLTPATRHLMMATGIANGAGSSLGDDLASADLVVLNHRYDPFQYPGPFHGTVGSGRPNEVLRERFQPAGRFGVWELLERRGR